MKRASEVILVPFASRLALCVGEPVVVSMAAGGSDNNGDAKRAHSPSGTTAVLRRREAPTLNDYVG